MNPIDRAIQSLAERRANGEKIVHKSWQQKAEENPTSMKYAIAANCWQCAGSGADSPGETKETIRTCNAKCPLINFRPYK
jgi:hypothetical protein